MTYVIFGHFFVTVLLTILQIMYNFIKKTFGVLIDNRTPDLNFSNVPSKEFSYSTSFGL